MKQSLREMLLAGSLMLGSGTGIVCLEYRGLHDLVQGQHYTPPQHIAEEATGVGLGIILIGSYLKYVRASAERQREHDLSMSSPDLSEL